MGQNIREDWSYTHLLSDGHPTQLELDGQSHTVFAAAFAHAVDGIALATLDGYFHVVNRAMCTLLGMAEPELIGAPLSSVLAPRAAEAVEERLKLVRTGTQRSFSRDCEAFGRLGRPLWLALTVALVRDSQGEPVFLTVSARDITDSKQLEQVLLTSDRRFRTIFNSLTEGFVETTPDGQIVDVNQPLCRMLGYGREELVGRSIRQFLDHNSCALVTTRLGSGRTCQTTFQASLSTKTDVSLDAQIYATILADENGTTSGATAIVLDVTERNRAQQALQASEQRNRTLVESIQDGLIMVADGRFQYVNTPFAEMLGFAAGDLVGRPIASVLVDKRVHGSPDEPTMLPAGETIVAFVTHWGSQVLAHVNCATSHCGSGQTLSIATVKDVTEQRRIEQDLRKLSSAVEHSPASVFITDLEGRIEYVNPTFTEVTGYSLEEARGQPPSLLKSGETPQSVYEDLWSTLTSGKTWRGEFRNKRKDGTLYWEFTSVSPIRDEDGHVSHFVAVKQDITHRKEAELLAWRQANFDQVTGLPNRVLFKDRLSQALLRCKRDASRVAVMFIDLDHFKAVNDTLGHEAGDQVLKQVGERLSQCVRDTDTVARLAGDEFTTILPAPGSTSTMTSIAQRILDALKRPFLLDDTQQVYIGCSIGIAVYPDDGSDGASLLRSADHAMYCAKESGRNTYQYFTPAMNRMVATRMQMESDLRRALAEGQFAVHFQPMVEATTRTIHGAEALVRWAHPVRGLLSPGDFLPVVEEIGLIADVGALVLHRACAQCALWRDAGYPDMTVAVNVSLRQLSAPNFLETLDQALSQSGLPSHALELEVSEKVLLSSIPAVDAALRSIADRGIALTIDDFGTGASSLQHLRRFPFSTLKVDRSFVHNVLQNHEDTILVEAVIAMARKLGLRVLAEGVETPDQIDYLLTQYCDMFQGFLFGKPLPSDEFSQQLAQHRVSGHQVSGHQVSGHQVSGHRVSG